MRSARLLLLVLALGVHAGCNPAAPAGSDEAAIGDPTAQVARSPHGMVASAAVPATEVGARVLARGGNAVDAAVATGFALAVSEPAMSGIAGRASILIRMPSGEVHGIDGLNAVPAGYGEGGAEGYDRAAVPGTLAGLTRALEEHGSWPLERVMAPAIALAEEGFTVGDGTAARLASAADDLRNHAGSAAVFLRPDGTPHEAGDRLRQPELARTLRAIADEGPEVFYTGWIADSVHADMARNGGFITREDMAGYQALDAIPVEGSYRGHALVSNFRPASGHAVIQALQALEEVEGAEALLRDDVAWAALVGPAMHLAIGDRNRREGDEPASARFLTSREHARELAELIPLPEPEPAEAGEPAPAGAGGTAAAADESATVRATAGPSAQPEVAWRPGDLVTGPDDRDATTHFSVVDAGGTVVSITQSLGPAFGTRLVAPGLGFVYATRLGSEPGSRPSSTIAPTLVLDSSGEPLLALGGAGDARIISSVIQVISRVLDQGLDPAAALRAPRVHPDGEGALRVEAGDDGWSEEERLHLESFGLETSTSPPGYFGRVHAVMLEPDGFLGVAEPRWPGSAAGPVDR